MVRRLLQPPIHLSPDQRHPNKAHELHLASIPKVPKVSELRLASSSLPQVIRKPVRLLIAKDPSPPLSVDSRAMQHFYPHRSHDSIKIYWREVLRHLLY